MSEPTKLQAFGYAVGDRIICKMQLKLDPRNAIPVLELVPYLGVSEIFSHLTTSAWVDTVNI